MKIGSLFSGAGGLDLAVEQVFGGRTVWHCELDPAASKVLAARWPGVPNLGDITAVDWAAVDEPIDILCGGFPCQDVSSAGRRAGLTTTSRSGLWSRYADAIAALHPKLVIIENVRGLLSAKAHRTMESSNPTVGDRAGRPVLRAAGAVLGDLADLGYDAQWTTVAAASVGAPHRRERVFIVATNTDSGGRGGCTQRDLEHGCAVGSAGPVELLPTPGANDGDRGTRSDEALLRKAERGLRLDRQKSLSDVPRLLPTPHFGPGLHGNDGMDLRTTVTLLQTPSASDGAGGKTSRSGGRIDEPLLGGQAREMSTAWGKYEPAIRRWEQATRPAPPPTEPNRNGNPRLSAAFSEWLMGWPAGWVTDVDGISRKDALRIVGNGCVPQQAIVSLTWLLKFADLSVGAGMVTP